MSETEASNRECELGRNNVKCRVDLPHLGLFTHVRTTLSLTSLNRMLKPVDFKHILQDLTRWEMAQIKWKGNYFPLFRFSGARSNQCVRVKRGTQFVFDIYYIWSSTPRCDFLHFGSLKICEKMFTVFCLRGSKGTFWKKKRKKESHWTIKPLFRS